MPSTPSYVTRFAPSPTGILHQGHALSALLIQRLAEAHDGKVLLRIEDIDRARCRADYEASILADLHWLGFEWSGPVWRQSQRLSVYADALARLQARDLVYPCFCTRSDIRAEDPKIGFEGPIYPGTCLDLDRDEALRRIANGQEAAWRLNLDRALEEIGGPIIWRDAHAGEQKWDGEGWGDVVLARKDIATSYHLAVTIDDAAQGITHIVRGKDLFQATHIHVVLQRLLGLPTPYYCHHGLIEDAEGSKLAKSKGASGLREGLPSDAGPEVLITMLEETGALSTKFEQLMV